MADVDRQAGHHRPPAARVETHVSVCRTIASSLKNNSTPFPVKRLAGTCTFTTTKRARVCGSIRLTKNTDKWWSTSGNKAIRRPPENQLSCQKRTTFQ